MVMISRRSPLVWTICALLSAGAWALLVCGRTDAGLGLMFAGGWNLSLLPVHARLAARSRGTVKTRMADRAAPLRGRGDPAVATAQGAAEGAGKPRDQSPDDIEH
jgi:hypothetical protein